MASIYFLFDDKVKDTLYKFWVLKVRLRDWGFEGGSLMFRRDRDSINGLRPPSPNGRFFDNTMEHQRAGKDAIFLAFWYIFHNHCLPK